MLEATRILLMRNEAFFVTSACVLFVFFSIVRTFQIHAINKKMKLMMKKIKEYMEAIALEEEPSEKSEEREEIVRYIQKELEKGKKPEETHKISEEDEKLFDHVLKEYFP
ncbi:MAG: hypothetical protein ACI4HI_09290 [Lachnospiraceae bacterium]